MPDVPVLVQSGDLDTNTPIEQGRAAAAQFAHPIFGDRRQRRPHARPAAVRRGDGDRLRRAPARPTRTAAGADVSATRAGRGARPARVAVEGPLRLRVRRGQRERQRLAVRARAQRRRWRSIDCLNSIVDRVVGDRAPHVSRFSGEAESPRCCTPCRCWRRCVPGPAAAAGSDERAVDQMARADRATGRRPTAARHPRSRSRSPSWTRSSPSRRPA